MDKDIFVDNNIAKNFCNPLDPEYKKFIIWLLTDGFLVVSNKILGEYNRTCSHSYSSTNIAIIVNKLLQEGRLKKYGNPELKKIVFKKSIVRRLRSNFKDHDHIRLVILSDRKYALVRDDNLIHDINSFPGINAVAVKRPQDLPYSK